MTGSTAALHLAADRLGNPAHLAGDPDAEFVPVIVPAIVFADRDAAGFDSYSWRGTFPAQPAT
jgi:hypothetical protein